MSGNDLNLSEGNTQEKDDLTKLYTRMQQENWILERLLKNADEQGVLLLIDLDDFCRINQPVWADLCRFCAEAGCKPDTYKLYGQGYCCTDGI